MGIQKSWYAFDKRIGIWLNLLKRLSEGGLSHEKDNN